MRQTYFPSHLYMPDVTEEMMKEMTESISLHTPLGAFLEMVLVRYGNILANVYEKNQWEELVTRNLVDKSKAFVVKGMRVDSRLPQ